MGRDMVKVRKVGQSLVVTLTQDVLSEVNFEEGDRLLLEPIPPRRIVISKEAKTMTSTRRIELQLEHLENQRQAMEAERDFLLHQYKTNMPVEEGADDEATVGLSVMKFNRDISRIDVEISQKKLELFDAQGE